MKTTKYLKVLMVLAGVLFLLIYPVSSKADTIYFYKITSNTGSLPANQLYADVTPLGTGVSFRFYNNVGIASNVSEIYFDDGALLALASVVSYGGANFIQGATPGNLPGGGGISPPFVTTATFLAGAINPSPTYGLNDSGDSVDIIFSLQTGKTFSDVLADLKDGDLRIGLHVQAIALPPSSGNSDSYVNKVPVPEPGILILLGIAMSAIGVASYRIRKL